MLEVRWLIGFDERLATIWTSHHVPRRSSAVSTGQLPYLNPILMSLKPGHFATALMVIAILLCLRTSMTPRCTSPGFCLCDLDQSIPYLVGAALCLVAAALVAARNPIARIPGAFRSLLTPNTITDSFAHCQWCATDESAEPYYSRCSQCMSLRHDDCELGRCPVCGAE